MLNYSNNNNKSITKIPAIKAISCTIDLFRFVSLCISGIKSEPAIYIKLPIVIGIKIDVTFSIRLLKTSPINAPIIAKDAEAKFINNALVFENPE